MINGHLLLSVVIAAAAFGRIEAAQYHVSTSGSDSNSGSSSSPWRSITKAVGAARAGDTVLIGGGTYRHDRLYVANSGTSSSPITFAAASGQSPVIEAQEFGIIGRSYIIVRGLTFRGPKQLPGNWRDIPTRIIDDSSVKIVPSESWSTRSGKVRRKYATFMRMLDSWENNQSKGITVNRSRNITLTGNTLTHHTRGILIGEGSAQITVENNTARYCQWGIQSWAASGSVSVSDAQIRGNTAEQCWDHGIFVIGTPTRVTISGNRCRNNAVNGIGIQAGARDCTVRGNRIEHGGYYSETMQAPGASAISAFGLGTGCVIDGNYCAYQQDLTHFDGNGIIIDTSRNPARVSNNVCYRNMGSGITQTMSPGCTIVNNTCAENGWNTTHAYNGVGIRFAKTSDVNAVVANNILYLNKRGGVMGADLMRQSRIDANVYTLVGGTPMMRNGYSSGFTTLDAVRSGTKYEDRGRVGDPRFVNAGAADYRLASGSAAVGAADSSLATGTDLDGRDRDGDPDCGAFERVGSSTIDQPSTGSYRVDFKPGNAASVSGWLADTGASFASRGNGLSYGWSTSMSGEARERNQSSDQLRDTLIQMQRSSTSPRWEMALPNGSYRVRVVCGDPAYFDSVYRMQAEGTVVVDGTPTSGSRFVDGTVTVQVSDGRLTLGSASGSRNNKVCQVEITRLP
ncbi:MAG TPA: right-handed parallel beta-helix repeat-containing protein [Planctomycetota bacterium]|nr:right-handed parallel beta-helix repeat-containing protein [Planctomycetota bacterium]